MNFEKRKAGNFGFMVRGFERKNTTPHLDGMVRVAPTAREVCSAIHFFASPFCFVKLRKNGFFWFPGRTHRVLFFLIEKTRRRFARLGCDDRASRFGRGRRHLLTRSISRTGDCFQNPRCAVSVVYFFGFRRIVGVSHSKSQRKIKIWWVKIAAVFGNHGF